MGVAMFYITSATMDNPRDHLEGDLWKNARSRRVGPGFCVHGHKLYRWRGGTAFLLAEEDEKEMILHIFDFMTGKWHIEMTGFARDSNDIPSSITGAQLVGYGDNLYLFGGFGTLESDTYFSDLHQLNLSTFKWRKLSSNSIKGSPIAKYLCGMVVLDQRRAGCLLIFGGFGSADGAARQEGAAYHWSTEFQAMWTNELHMYDIGEQLWIDVQTSGIRPPPCAASSFIQIDKSRILLFGGRQCEKRVNEIHILDFVKWHWSGAIVPTSHLDPWPKERSLHTAVCLVDPQHVPSNISTVPYMYPNFNKQRVLMIWGQDANSDPISDTWILDINDMSWIKQDNYFPWDGRKWHSTCAYYPTPSEAIVVICGGFTKRETQLSSWQQLHEIDVDFLYAKIGISSLYEICLNFVCSNADMENKISLLPKHIQLQVENYKSTSKQYKSLSLYKLN